MKTNVRQVQRSENKWETSYILSLINRESPTVFTAERAGKFEIKPCVEHFVLCALIYCLLIYNTNAQFIEHGNDSKMMHNVTTNYLILNI